MKPRRLPAVLAALLALTPAAAHASTTLATSVVSHYFFRGERRAGPSLQPWLEQRCDALALGLWATTPLAHNIRGESDPELDFYGNYRFKLTDALGLTSGFMLHDYPRANTHAGHHRATFEPSLALDCTLAGLRLTPTLYYDLQLDALTAELNAACAVPLKNLGTELDFDATLGMRTERDHARDFDPREKLRGDYASLGITVPFQITAQSKISAGFAYAKGFDFRLKRGAAPARPDPLAAARGVVTLSYARTF